MLSKSVPDDAIVGSPLKKQRASIFDGDSSRRETPQLGDILAKAEAAQKNQASPALPPAAAVKQEDSDEEL